MTEPNESRDRWEEKSMSDIEWQTLPSPMWGDPAVWTDVGDFTLLVFTQDGVPTWEVRRRAKLSSENRNDLVVDGTADTFDAAKAAALFEAGEQSRE
jgi:hypothetical protein